MQVVCGAGAGGALDSHFLFCLQSETNVGAEMFVFSFAPKTEMDRSRSSFGQDERKPRGIGAKCVYRLQPSEKRTSDRSSCRRVMRGGGGGERQQERFWRDRSKIKIKIQVSRRKKQKPRHRPLLRQAASHRARKLKKGSMVLSDTLCYILCIRRNAYSVLLKLFKHASFTDARSSWLERCWALLYSAFMSSRVM